MCLPTGDADSFGIDTVDRKSAFIVDGGRFITENTHYAFLTSGWTSTNASDTPFSTGVPFGTGSPYGSAIPLSKNVLCVPVDPGSASCTVHVTDQPTCSQFAALISGGPFESYVDDGQAGFKQPHVSDAGAHMSHNDSTPAFVSQSTLETVFASGVQLEPAQVVCDALSHNRTHEDVSDIGGETPKRNFLFLSGIAVDAYGYHLGESNQDESTALEMSQPSSRSDVICCDQRGNGSKPIPHFALDHSQSYLTGMYACTVMNSLFSSLSDLNLDT